jgi:hypothetical protein
MACWLMICVLHRRPIANLVKHCCVLVLMVKLWHATWRLVMQCLFIKECCCDWTVVVGLMILTLVIRGSKPWVLAHVLRL